ncbi:hypothetical protein JAAARDRAFT_40943, partial [Jaapia argillacea MUCL 33604]
MYTDLHEWMTIHKSVLRFASIEAMDFNTYPSHCLDRYAVFIVEYTPLDPRGLPSKGAHRFKVSAVKVVKSEPGGELATWKFLGIADLKLEERGRMEGRSGCGVGNIVYVVSCGDVWRREIEEVRHGQVRVSMRNWEVLMGRMFAGEMTMEQVVSVQTNVRQWLMETYQRDQSTCVSPCLCWRTIL